GGGVECERRASRWPVEPRDVDRPGARVDERGAGEATALAEEQVRAVAVREPVAADGEAGGRRREADPGRGRAVDGQPDEAHERGGLRDARGERLLAVADAGSVDVLRLEDREVATAEPRRREPRETGAVALVVDVDDEARP